MASRKVSSFSFEKNIAPHLPVWVGGVALAFAGFYLAKYSIEQGLLSPSMRIIMSTFFGSALLALGNWAHQMPARFPNKRIPQSLAGAGICVLYGTIFAANQLYSFIDAFTAFAGFSTITAGAIALSLRLGPPIAFMGLIGGFVTPGVVGQSEPNAMLMFTYLYVLFLGITEVLKKELRWIFSLVALMFAFGWVVIWITRFFVPADGIWLGIFLLALSATTVVRGHQAINSTTSSLTIPQKRLLVVNWCALGGALILTLLLAAKAQFGLTERLLVGALGAGSIVMAAVSGRMYGYIPLVAMGITATSLFALGTKDPWLFFTVWASYFALYAGGSFALITRTSKPFHMILLFSAASIVFTFLGYYKLMHAAGFNSEVYWGMTAFALAGISLYATQITRAQFGSTPIGQRMQGVCAITATTLISFCLGINLAYKFFGIALAAEIFALAWINTRIKLPEIRILINIMLAILLVNLVLGTSLLASMLNQVYYLHAARGLYVFNTTPWGAVIHLGVPGAFLIGARYLMHHGSPSERQGITIENLGINLVYLAGVGVLMGLFTTQSGPIPTPDKYILHHLIINFTLVMAIVCTLTFQQLPWLKTLTKQAHRFFILASSLLALAQFVYVFRYFSKAEIIGNLFFNSLLVSYLLPAVLTYFIGNAFAQKESIRLKHMAHFVSFIAAFLWVTYTINFYFHGKNVSFMNMSDAEVYAYSIAWLIYGIAVLAWGVYIRDKHMRTASFVLLVLVVIKVFLYDASKLDGLYRVMSFLGLGASLVGLGWFSSRFVFGPEKK